MPKIGKDRKVVRSPFEQEIGSLLQRPHPVVNHRGRSTPVTCRLEPFGGVENNWWMYTERPGESRLGHGTGPGGVCVLPPEFDMRHAPGNFANENITPSETYFGVSGGAAFFAGFPYMVTGGIRTGYSWLGDAAGSLIYRAHNAVGISSDAFRLKSDGSVGFTMLSDFWGNFEHAITADRTWTFPDRSGIVALTDDLSGHTHGAELTWDTVSGVTIGTASGSTLLSDSTGFYVIRFTGELSLDLTVSGAGGLDTGSEAANTWYAVHVIADSTFANSPDAIFSTSATAPTLPAGYDIFRRVGWVRNNGSSNIRKFIQTGTGRDRRIYWDEERGNVQPLAAGNATAFTAVSAAAFVPPTSRIFDALVAFDSTVTSDITELRPTGSTIADPATFIRVGIAAPNAVTKQMTLTTDASQSFDYRVTTGTNALDVHVISYEDSL